MATISELYQKGVIEEYQLGILAKAVICARLGCRESGQEVVFGNHSLRLADSLPPRQEPQVKRIEGGIQQTKPTAADRDVVNTGGLAPKAPASRAQTARRNPPTLQPMQKPAVRPATDQKSTMGQAHAARDVGLAKTEARTAGRALQQRPSQKVEQKAAKALPLFPSEEKTQLRQPAPQKSATGHPPPPSSGQEVQLRREANPSATVQKPTTQASERRETQEGVIEQSKLDAMSRLVAQEAKADVATARVVLSSVLSYLSAYPSVGILRLIDDIAKKTKADQRVIKVAIEALRSIDIIEVVDDAVVNLKKR